MIIARRAGCVFVMLLASPVLAFEMKDLIAGESMPGWEEKSETGKEVAQPAWDIKHGVLHYKGRGGGWWGSRQEYSDVVLDFEFKLPPGGNSGVYLRAPKPGERVTPASIPAETPPADAELYVWHPTYVGMEIQLLDDYADVYKNIKIWQHCGSVYHIAPAEKEALKKAGEWNRMRITAKADHITVELNGEKIVDVDGRTYPEIRQRKQRGLLGFQNHGTEVWLRSIKFADLTAERAERAASIGRRDPERWIDLAHEFSSDTIYWPTAEPFKLTTVAEGVTEKGYYYCAYSFCAAEHGGTHIDAPVHFAKGGQSVDQIPLENLIGDAVVVDVSERALADRDYRVRMEDFAAWEKRQGRIPDRAIVLIRTGYGRFWPDPVKYLGTARRGAEGVKELHFPGLHPDAARFLVEQRHVKAIGLDTASMDFGQSERYESHQILASHSVPGMENLARLEQLPPKGSWVIALPMKIEGGSGGPLRIVARIP